jgi:hypothetical protein
LNLFPVSEFATNMGKATQPKIDFVFKRKRGEVEEDPPAGTDPRLRPQNNLLIFDLSKFLH